MPRTANSTTSPQPIHSSHIQETVFTKCYLTIISRNSCPQ